MQRLNKLPNFKNKLHIKKLHKRENLDIFGNIYEVIFYDNNSLLILIDFLQLDMRNIFIDKLIKNLKNLWVILRKIDNKVYLGFSTRVDDININSFLRSEQDIKQVNFYKANGIWYGKNIILSMHIDNSPIKIESSKKYNDKMLYDVNNQYFIYQIANSTSLDIFDKNGIFLNTIKID